MNDRQRKILIAVGALIGLMLLYPPFQVMGRGLGYSWIFSPPYQAATINAGQLLIQWVAVALIGGIAYALSSESGSTSVKRKKLDPCKQQELRKTLLQHVMQSWRDKQNSSQEKDWPINPVWGAVIVLFGAPIEFFFLSLLWTGIVRLFSFFQ